RRRHGHGRPAENDAGAGQRQTKQPRHARRADAEDEKVGVAGAEGSEQEKAAVTPLSTGLVDKSWISRRRNGASGFVSFIRRERRYNPARREASSMGTRIDIELPSQIVNELGLEPDQLSCEMRIAAAIYWYGRSELSQEQAAQVAGLNRTDFLRACGRAGLDV